MTYDLTVELNGSSFKIEHKALVVLTDFLISFENNAGYRTQVPDIEVRLATIFSELLAENNSDTLTLPMVEKAIELTGINRKNNPVRHRVINALFYVICAFVLICALGVVLAIIPVIITLLASLGALLPLGFVGLIPSVLIILGVLTVGIPLFGFIYAAIKYLTKSEWPSGKSILIMLLIWIISVITFLGVGYHTLKSIESMDESPLAPSPAVVDSPADTSSSEIDTVSVLDIENDLDIIE